MADFMWLEGQFVAAKQVSLGAWRWSVRRRPWAMKPKVIPRAPALAPPHSAPCHTLGTALNLARLTNGNKPSATPDSACPKPELCALDSVLPGVSVRIKQLNGSAEVTNRLREMGFCEEQRIKLLMNHTNIICQVCNARLGISSQLAKTIMVEQIPAPTTKPKPT